MLGRTANGVYWMFRYLERMENTARLVDAGFRMALTRDAVDAGDEWRSVIVTLGLQDGYIDKYGEEFPGPQVFNYIMRDKDNPGSVAAMVEYARTNARMVRNAITRELWETVNESWIAVRGALARPLRETTLRPALDTVRRQSLLVHGAMEGTMLRNEVFNFGRIGKFIERADKTARLLDVKYYVLLPSLSHVGSRLDNVQWETVLRSVSGERAFRWLNAGQIDPRGIAEFLILDPRFPRSLASCYAKIRSNLGALASEYGEEMPCHAALETVRAMVLDNDIAAIFDHGLHEFIQDFVTANRQLGQQIEHDYRFYE